jgi:hypothetical protein
MGGRSLVMMPQGYLLPLCFPQYA